jgi:hypothetical protein
MKTISETALKKAIIAAEAERAKHPVALRPDRAELTRLRKARQASEKMVGEFVAQAGLDMKQFRAVQEQRSAEIDRLVQRQKADALERASRAQDTLHSGIFDQSNALAELGARDGFFPHPSFTLERPFLIWATPLQPIESSETSFSMESSVASFGSWAKFKFATSDYEGSQKVSFYFYWRNPFSDYAVINAATFISATGHLRSHAPWTIGVNTSWVRAWGMFGLWHGFPNNPTSSDYASGFLGHTGALGSTVTGGSTNGASVSTGANLYKTMFAVAPGAYVVFEVAISIYYRNDEGDIEADFESGGFRTWCPVVVFTLLNSPPKVMG